jgi:ABC-2 type transport system permease protein
MRKILFILQSYIQQASTYRGDIAIYVATSFILPFVLLNVWLTVSESKGASFGEKRYLVQYFLFQMIINVVIAAWHGQFLGRDIRQGNISQYLLKPFNYIWLSIGNNIGEKVWKLSIGVPVFILVAYFWQTYLQIPSISNLCFFFVAVFLGAVICFLLEHIVGISAFWIANTRALSDFNEMFFFFFSGVLFPLSYLTGLPFNRLFVFLPYKYIISFPLDTLLGQIKTNDIVVGVAIQTIWVVILYNVYKMLWEKGVKIYGGYGG